MVRRIYVEKQEGFDIEAQALHADLRENLHLENLTSVRVVNRYDMDGLDDATYEAARYTVFAEPAIDSVFDEEIAIDGGSVFFAVEYLPGQYDQRADSAAQCIRLMNVASDPLVQFARLIILSGKLSEAEVAAVKDYCINPVDSHEAALAKPAAWVRTSSQRRRIWSSASAHVIRISRRLPNGSIRIRRSNS